MLKLLKKLDKKEVILILVCLVFIVGQVWLDLKLPDYMSEITKLVQTEGSEIVDILVQGAYMLACAAGSLAFAAIVRILCFIYRIFIFSEVKRRAVWKSRRI